MNLRKFQMKDLDSYIYWNNPSREFHKYNGPYFKKTSVEELKTQIEEWRAQLLKGEEDVLKNRKLIVNSDTDELIGQVSWYWKSKETYWMEIGIVVFNEAYWGRGIGYESLKMWITELFNEKPELVRLGVTTWSGN